MQILKKDHEVVRIGDPGPGRSVIGNSPEILTAEPGEFRRKLTQLVRIFDVDFL